MQLTFIMDNHGVVLKTTLKGLRAAIDSLEQRRKGNESSIVIQISDGPAVRITMAPDSDEIEVEIEK